MPVYEFYCRECHAIFNFLSRRVNTDRTPACPRCKRPGLEKQVSPFAISRNLQERPEELPDMDESRLEQAMIALAGEMDNMDEMDMICLYAHIVHFVHSVYFIHAVAASSDSN